MENGERKGKERDGMGKRGIYVFIGNFSLFVTAGMYVWMEYVRVWAWVWAYWGFLSQSKKEGEGDLKGLVFLVEKGGESFLCDLRGQSIISRLRGRNG